MIEVETSTLADIPVSMYINYLREKVLYMKISSRHFWLLIKIHF